MTENKELIQAIFERCERCVFLDYNPRGDEYFCRKNIIFTLDNIRGECPRKIKHFWSDD